MDREILRKTWGSIGRALQNHSGGSISALEICHNSIYHRYERPLSITLTEAERAYKICSDDFDRLKPYADVYRARFLARRVKEEVASGNIKKSNKLRVSWIER